MKVLIACEYSGIVRDAFIKNGHNAVSCDLLPTESLGPHYQGDILDFLKIEPNWDLMIAHPPCTYLSFAGNGWFNEKKYGNKARERKKLRIEAVEFVDFLFNLAIPKIAIENPMGHLTSHWKKQSQIIQPWQFGDEDSKRTCLWLKNLRQLIPTKFVRPKAYGYFKSGKKKGKPIYFTDALVNSENRAKKRAKTFKGIAEAMADQWGKDSSIIYFKKKLIK